MQQVSVRQRRGKSLGNEMEVIMISIMKMAGWVGIFNMHTHSCLQYLGFSL